MSFSILFDHRDSFFGYVVYDILEELEVCLVFNTYPKNQNQLGVWIGNHILTNLNEVEHDREKKTKFGLIHKLTNRWHSVVFLHF